MSSDPNDDTLYYPDSPEDSDQTLPVPKDTSGEQHRKADSHEESPSKESSSTDPVPAHQFDQTQVIESSEKPAPAPPQESLATEKLSPAKVKPDDGDTMDSGDNFDHTLDLPDDVTAPFNAFPNYLSEESSLPTLPGYDLLDELGRGGMGVVYKARQLGLNRLVAVKMVLGGGHASEGDLQRFRLEAEAVARIQHANIIQIYEVGESQGHPYISFEFADGGSLADLLTGEPIPNVQSAHLVEILARAMHVAHQRDIIHRDLKPANILMVTQEDTSSLRESHDLQIDRLHATKIHGAITPRISDFGLAKNLASKTEQTATGAVMGTPSYMAPEQAEGKIEELGPAVDVYALGAILYELLTGRPPFRGESAWETVNQVINEEPVPPRRLRSGITRDLEVICLKCLQKETHHRYETALDLAEDLRRFRQGEPIQARPVGPIRRLIKWTRRNPSIAGMMALVAFVIVSALVTTTALWLNANSARREAELERQNAERSASLARQAQLRVEKEKQQVEKLNREVGKAYEQSQANYREAQRASYAAHLHEAKDAYNKAHFQRAQTILDRLIPLKKEDNDFRDFEWWYLHDLSKSRRTVAEHVNDIADISLSPDLRWLATGGLDHRVLIWDLNTGSEKYVLTGHSGAVRSVTISPDGKTLASASEDHDVRLWNVDTGELIRVLSGHADWVVRVTFSADGKKLASASQDGTIRIWSVKNGNLEMTLTDHSYGVTDVAFNPRGDRLVSGSLDQTVRLWDLGTRRSEILYRHNHWVLSVAWSPDGKWIASSSQDKTVRVWNSQTLKEEITLEPAKEPVIDVKFAPGGIHLAGLLQSHTAVVWELPGFREILPRSREKVRALAFSPQGKLLRSMQFDLHSLEREKGLPEHEDSVLAVAFQPEGDLLASADGAGVVILWDAKKREVVHRLTDHTRPVRRVVFSPNGKALLTAGDDAVIRVWDVKTGELLKKLPGQRGWIYALAISPDGKYVFSAGVGKGIYVWDLEQESALHILPVRGRAIYGLAVHPTKKILASSGSDGTISLWDWEKEAQIGTLTGHQGRVQDVVFSPDGSQLTSAGWDKTIRLWDVEARTLQSVLRGHNYGLHRVVYSPDGKRLASASEDKTIRIWDVTPGHEGRELLTIQRHTAGVTSLSFSSDGIRLASGSMDQTVRLHEAKRATD